LKFGIGLAVKSKLFVPAVVHTCPKLFWDVEVIVSAGVIVVWFGIFYHFPKQIGDLFNCCG
jgi:hypothetical protein